MVQFSVSGLLAAFLASSSFVAKAVDVELLQNSICTNCGDIDADLGFADPAFDPWEPVKWTGYDTEIANVNCVVQVDHKASKEMGGRLVYALKNVSPDVSCPDTTHTGPCGACSDLKSLALFLESDTVEEDSAQCGIVGLPIVLAANNLLPADPTNTTELLKKVLALNAKDRSGEAIIVPPAARNAIMQCLMGVGFTGACALTWTSGVLSTLKTCSGECFIARFAQLPPTLPGPPPAGTYPMGFGQNYCGQCQNTINHGAVSHCYPEASQFGSEFRLNECLQCDECINQPSYFKYSGRVRRNSGIVSNIPRPESDVPVLTHDYCIGEKCPKAPKECRDKSLKLSKTPKAKVPKSSRTKAPKSA